MEQYYFVCGKNVIETKMNVKKTIQKWINSKELKMIVRAFGGKFPSGDNVEELAEWLLKFSDNWDYRKKQMAAKDSRTGETARWMVSSECITQEQEKIVFENVNKLGLKGISDPLLEYYDYVIALGGARMSCLFRPRFVKEILEKKKFAPHAIVMLSGIRPVMESEREATDTYAPKAETEYDLINAGAEMVFDLQPEYTEERYCSMNPNGSWAIREYLDSKYNFPILSVAGPSSEPDKRRANSADTFCFFAEKQQIPPESKILLVTSQIYVPYQQMEAIRTWAIPNNVYVETVGFPIEWNENKQQGMMEAANYLQEIRSTIQAVNRYLHNNRIQK